MQPSKEFQEKMRVINANQSEKGISQALALQWTTGRAIIQWWGEGALSSSEQWLAYQNDSKCTLMIHPGGHKSTQNNVCRSADLACLIYSQCLGFNNEKVTLQKQNPQESSEAKANADQKDYKSSSNLCWKHMNKPQKLLCLLPKVEVLGPLHPPKKKKKKTPLYFITRTSFHESRMVVVWWSGPAFLLQDLEKQSTVRSTQPVGM